MTDKIQIDRTVVEQALTTLQMYGPSVVRFGLTFKHGQDAIDELRAALEQPQPKREPIPNVMMDLGWELHGSNDPYQSWCMAVEWTERAHGIGGEA